MSKPSHYFVFVLITMLFLPALVIGKGDPAFNGKWTLIKEKSSEIGLYEISALDIREDASSITIIQTWGTSRFFRDTLVLKTDGAVNHVPVRNRV